MSDYEQKRMAYLQGRWNATAAKPHDTRIVMLIQEMEKRYPGFPLQDALARVRAVIDADTAQRITYYKPVYRDGTDTRTRPLTFVDALEQAGWEGTVYLVAPHGPTQRIEWEITELPVPLDATPDQAHTWMQENTPTDQ